MSSLQPPGRRPPPGGGPGRRLRSDDTLPGVLFPVVEDLTRITADDEFLDAIAAGGADLRSLFAGGGAASTPLSAAGGVGSRRPVGLGPLLVAWRSELLEPPLPALPTLAARLMLAPADRSRRRSMRSLLSVGAAICALLLASTIVGAHSAEPGQPLWGLNVVLFSDHANSVQAKVNIESAIAVAQRALIEGNPAKARAVLRNLDGEVDKVLPADGRAALQRDVDELQKQVGMGPGGAVVAQSSSSGTATVTSGTSDSVGSGGVLPLVIAAGQSRPPAADATVPTVASGVKPSGVAVSTPAGGQLVAQGGGGGPVGNPPSITSLPVVPVLPATTSSPVAPVNPGPPVTPGPPIGPVATTNPAVPAPATTVGSSTPVVPTTPSPGTTPDPPTTGAPTTEAPTTDTPTTDAPTTDATTTDAPTTDVPTTDVPTTDVPTTDVPTSIADPSTSGAGPTTDAPTDVSTTSVIPTTLDTTPSTDANGSTIGNTSTTTTQPAAVDTTDDNGTPEHVGNGGSVNLPQTSQSALTTDPAGQTGPAPGAGG